MGDSLDDWVGSLQEEIDDRARADYGETVFRRWKDPLYLGVMQNPDGRGRVTGTCGDTMQMFLRVDGGRVSEASYATDGCGASSACGSFAAEMARGKTVQELMEVTGEAVLAKAGRLPEEDRHCAFLAAAALQSALEDYLAARRSQQQ